MRIRSIKPEFWRSDDITSLDWEVRLLFIGLWSYVDDNGVGRDVEKLIVADLFPLEEEPRETLATVSRGLQDLSRRGLIVRYSVDGSPLLHITNWAKHQRIDKPNRARYEPPTCANVIPRDNLATTSRDPRESPAPGAVDLGNRGAGEQRSSGVRADAPTSPGRALALVDDKRLDVERLCTHLAEAIESTGAKKPTITARWRTEARLMLDRDGRTEEEVTGCLRWLFESNHSDAAWWRAGRIMSMPKLREKFDQLRLQAQRPGSGGTKQDQTDDLFDRAMQRARAADGGNR